MPGGIPIGVRCVASLLALCALAYPASAEAARGIDEAFFAPGGALDQTLPVTAVPAPGAATAPAAAAPAATAPGQVASGEAASLGGGAVPAAVADPLAAPDPVAAAGEAIPDASAPGAADGGVEDPGLPLGADDLASSGLRMVTGLAFVIALIFGVNAFLKRTRGGSLGVAHGMIRRIATEPIGPNQAVTILEVAGKVLVVGITDKGMTSLGELDGEHADRVRLMSSQAAVAEHGEASRGGFGRALRGFTRGWRGEELTPDAAVAPGMEPAPARSAARRAPERRGAASPAAKAPSSPASPRFEPLDPMPAGASGLGSPRGAEERRRRLDERASAFLAQQREALRGMNL